MELNKTSTLVVKKWIEEKRIALVNEMTAIRARIDVYTQMLKELEANTPVVIPMSGQMKSRGRKIGSKAEQVTLLALDAAGKAGLTARELSDVAHMPKGTARARLTVMKAKGMVTHVQPRYFAVHSTQEDNNVDQSA